LKSRDGYQEQIRQCAGSIAGWELHFQPGRLRLHKIFRTAVRIDCRPTSSVLAPFERVDTRASGFGCVQFAASEQATHVMLRRPKK
jgi:hypothetical protein